MEEKQELPQQNIILDSNIIQYAADKATEEEVILYLTDLLNRKFGLVISDITVYELLKGAYIKTEAAMLQLLNIFQRYELTNNVLFAAAQMETL